MTDGNSIVNLGDVVKPVTVLVEKISDLVGGGFAPRQTKRMAAADAEARVIEAQAEKEASIIRPRPT